MGVLAADPPAIRDARFVFAVLPTVYPVFEAHLAPLIAREKPAAIVSFGLDAKAAGFKLERVAANACRTDRPDAAGGCAPDSFLDAAGPATCASTLPLAAIAAHLTEAQLPWSWSDSAGDYMCNLVFYRTRRALSDAATGFIHVPYTETMRAQLGLQDALALSEDALQRGARIALGEVAHALAAETVP